MNAPLAVPRLQRDSYLLPDTQLHARLWGYQRVEAILHAAAMTRDERELQLRLAQGWLLMWCKALTGLSVRPEPVRAAYDVVQKLIALHRGDLYLATTLTRPRARILMECAVILDYLIGFVTVRQMNTARIMATDSLGLMPLGLNAQNDAALGSLRQSFCQADLQAT